MAVNSQTHRPFKNEDLGKRLKIVWEGAEYRGRFRQVVWDGTAKFTGNEIISATPINFFNQDKTLSKTSPTHLKWQALTTGNIGGFEVILDDPYSGNLEIETPLISFRLPIEEVGFEDKIFDKSGVLPRYIKIFRLPDNSLKRQFSFTEKILIKPNVDNPIFIRATLEDGTLCWTSPIYLYR